VITGTNPMVLRALRVTEADRRLTLCAPVPEPAAAR
jgi:hypothetical protein